MAILILLDRNIIYSTNYLRKDHPQLRSADKTILYKYVFLFLLLYKLAVLVTALYGHAGLCSMTGKAQPIIA